MMIAPPAEFFGRRVFEINDGVRIAVEHVPVEKQIAGAMQQSAVRNFRVRMNSFEVKARERGCRGNAVKAVAVIKDAKFHLWYDKKPVDRKSTRLNSSHIPLSRM